MSFLIGRAENIENENHGSGLWLPYSRRGGKRCLTDDRSGRRDRDKRRRKRIEKTLRRIEELAQEYEERKSCWVSLLKICNNTAVGERVEKTEIFKEMLERRLGLPVILWDERLTTVAAERILMESGVRRENRKEYVDQVAAGLILRDIWIPYAMIECRKGRQRNGRENHHDR